MSVFANRLVDFLIRFGNATEENRDIYTYGIEATLSIVINLTFTLLIGALLSMPLQMLVFIIPFSLLRITIGGVHAKTIWRCVLYSLATAAVVAILIVAEKGNSVTEHVLTLLFAFSSIMVASVYAPILNNNQPINKKEAIKFRKLARYIAIGCTLVCITLLAVKLVEYAFCVSLGMFVSAVSALVVVIKSKFNERRTQS